jgi:hypothetical protein
MHWINDDFKTWQVLHAEHCSRLCQLEQQLTAAASSKTAVFIDL